VIYGGGADAEQNFSESERTRSQKNETLPISAACQGKIHFSTTAGMKLNHHGNFKVQRFQLCKSIKKDDCAPSPTVPHLPLDQRFPNFFERDPNLSLVNASGSMPQTTYRKNDYCVDDF